MFSPDSLRLEQIFQCPSGLLVRGANLDYSDDSIIEQIDWKPILTEVRKFDGCHEITWAIPMEDNQKPWTTIRKIKYRLPP